MLFFPYKVDIDLKRLPIVTILVCVACIAIYFQQHFSNIAVEKSAVKYCQKKQHRNLHITLVTVVGQNDIDSCVRLLSTLHTNSDPQNAITSLIQSIGNAKANGSKIDNDMMLSTLVQVYDDFSKTAPPSLTANLMYDPHSLIVKRMLSSAFAHGSWLHLLGNLFFFYAFAASVEIILGSITFIGIILSLAVGTNLAYSATLFTETNVLPTLGLSGVVMGMIGLFTFLIPTAKIRCFFWFIIIIRIFAIPAWILALWYVGLDIFNLYYGGANHSNVNLVAHVSGAAIGVLMGIVFFRKRRPTLTATKRLRGIN